MINLSASYHIRTDKERGLWGLKALVQRSSADGCVRCRRCTTCRSTCPKGTVLGVIGRNGAGKSTLLRTISGILAPSQGRVVVRGRISPLLSVGLGMHPDLSGRENIRLGALAFGHSAEQTCRSSRSRSSNSRSSASTSSSRSRPIRAA